MASLDHYPKPERGRKQSKFDPFETPIWRWLEDHPDSGVQILQRLRSECGYEGGYSVLKEYLALVRPKQAPAFLTLAFAPGECAQIDWGSYGFMQIGFASMRKRMGFERRHFRPRCMRM